MLLYWWAFWTCNASLPLPGGSDKEMPMIWIFPYFFEPRILECFPSFVMLDYQV